MMAQCIGHLSGGQVRSAKDAGLLRALPDIHQGVKIFA